MFDAAVLERGAPSLLDDPLADQWWPPAGPHDEPVVDLGPGDVPVDGERWPTSVVALAPWESAACLEVSTPGGDLATVLELVDPTAVDDRTLVEAVAAWEKLAAWAHLGASLTAAELARRASMNPHWNAPAPANQNVAGDELAMRLAWSRPAANRLVRDGRALENELLLVADAVREGAIDTPKMRVLTDRLHDRPGELAWAVQEAVLPGAASRTPGQLAADVDRALLAVDPLDAADRLARAVTKRHVCHPKPLPDGMAGLWAVLPATDAVRIDATLEATARTARALGDPRTLDQIRADTLTALATGQALLDGSAPLSASTMPDRRVAPRDGTRNQYGVDAHETEAGGGGSLECGVDADAAEDGRGEEPRPTPVGPSHQDVRPPGMPPIRIPRVRIDVTVALSTLMGLDDNPAELAGFGPISAEQARALADGGTWRRLVTDPLTGAVLDVGRTRYRPPQPLADHVAARDRCCAAPGCSVPASRCDLDHTTEYHGTPANGSTTPGTTSADNLGPLSHRCHRLKTDGGFTLTQPEPGVFEWHTPAGLDYRVVPGHHGHTRQLSTPSAAEPHSGYPDEPPF